MSTSMSMSMSILCPEDRLTLQPLQPALAALFDADGNDDACDWDGG